MINIVYLWHLAVVMLQISQSINSILDRAMGPEHGFFLHTTLC